MDRNPYLKGYLQYALHLSRSLRGRTLTHSSIADAGVWYSEIGVVESVEHLDSELQRESSPRG